MVHVVDKCTGRINPYCKVEFVTSSQKVERKAASRHLRQLEEIGILESCRVGKENVFINRDLIELLKG